MKQYLTELQRKDAERIHMLTNPLASRSERQLVLHDMVSMRSAGSGDSAFELIAAGFDPRKEPYLIQMLRDVSESIDLTHPLNTPLYVSAWRVPFGGRRWP